MRGRKLWWVLGLAAGCSPRSIEEAESKGNVRWLAEHGTAPAVAALGRLADGDAHAVDALRERAAEGSTGALVAAWEASRRGSPWGIELLRANLADPVRADAAAQAMARRDPALERFVPDLDRALALLAPQAKGASVAGVLASAGPKAADAIAARLRDGSTRSLMCQGIFSKEADGAARKALMDAPATSRDDGACVRGLAALASTDAEVFGWLAQKGEPGLVREASDTSGLTCDKLKTLWTTVFASRTADEFSSLTVALSAAARRCPKELDGTVSRALRALPHTHGAVVDALDPQARLIVTMPLTCVEVDRIARTATGRNRRRESTLDVVAARAADIVAQGCSRPR